MSVPLTSGRRRHRSRSSGAGLELLIKLVWWMLYYGAYWPCRLIYFDLPRAGWRAWQRRQARRALAAGAPDVEMVEPDQSAGRLITNKGAVPEPIS